MFILHDIVFIFYYHCSSFNVYFTYCIYFLLSLFPFSSFSIIYIFLLLLFIIIIIIPFPSVHFTLFRCLRFHLHSLNTFISLLSSTSSSSITLTLLFITHTIPLSFLPCLTSLSHPNTPLHSLNTP